MKTKLIASGAIFLLLAIIGYAAFFRGNTQKYRFRFDTVSVGKLTASVSTTGTVNPLTSVDVGTQASGIISKLYADFNSEVKAGQVIAKIDPTTLVQAVRDAEASLSSAQAQRAESQRIVDREKALHDRAYDSQENYDSALTVNELNAAAVRSAEANLSEARTNLAHATIRAPISGVVINRAVNVGQTVAASFSSPTLFTIANDLRKMQVETTVDESDIGMINLGQNATFTVDAYPDEQFSGTVSQIRLAPATVENVVTYTVIFDVNNEQLKLIPGMTANVRIQVASAENCLKVPNMALRLQPPGDAIDTSISTAATGKGAPSSALAAESLGTATAGRKGRAAHAEAVVQRAEEPARNATFGITEVYPEFEKGAYVPSHQSGRARIWILNAKGKLEPVLVKTGVSDGRYTEVTSPDLKPGEQIVVGVESSADAAGYQAQSPFTGGGQQRQPGGLFR